MEHAARSMIAQAAVTLRSQPVSPASIDSPPSPRSLPLLLLLAASAVAVTSLLIGSPFVNLTLRLTAAVLFATAAIQGLLSVFSHAALKIRRRALLR